MNEIRDSNVEDGIEVIVGNSPGGESQSNGFIENCIKGILWLSQTGY